MSYIRCSGFTDYSIDGENWSTTEGGFVYCNSGQWEQITPQQLADELSPLITLAEQGGSPLHILTERQFTDGELMIIAAAIGLCLATGWAFKILGKQLFPKG